ncbi:hypothetical protein JX266_004334 [Neoarthrinium moseri]|nr:hypothetical protein JX266_004334 [Neoarthrinium moseri]
MPALPNLAGGALNLLSSASSMLERQVTRNRIVARYSTSYNDDYNRARTTISGGIIAVIVIIIVVVLAVCIGGCCFYNRSQKRRQQRRAEMSKWQTDHPNAMANNTSYNAYQATSMVPPPTYTGVTEPGAAHVAGHHGATTTDNGGGYSTGGGGGSGGAGGTGA